MDIMIENVREDDQKQFSSDWANVKLHSTKILKILIFLDELSSYYNSNFKTLVYSNFANIEDIKIKFKKIIKNTKEKIYRMMGIEQD